MSKFTKTIAGFAGSIALIASLAGSVSAATFSTNLTVGSRGADVSALQSWLIGKGYSVPAGATGYFGGQTKAALAAYQSAKGISPAVGYFGPITRAAVNADAGGSVSSVPGCAAGAMYSSTTGASCSTGTVSNGNTSGPVMDGTDGSLTVTYSPFAPSSQTLKKGDMNKPVIAVKLSATSGKVNVNRFDVEFSDRPWLFFSKITLKDSNGNVVATKVLSSANDATEVTVGSDYFVRFDNVNYVVDPNATDPILVAYLDVVNSSDKITGNTVNVAIPVGNIRSINGKGYTDSLGITSGTGSSLSSPVALTLSSTGSTGTVYTRLSPSSPAKRLVTTSATQVTSDVVLGVFGVKVQNQNATLNTLSFNINNSTSVATSTLYQNVRLYSGSTLVAGANSLVAGSPTFTNLTIPLTQDVWTDLTLKADVNINQSGLDASSTLVAASIVGTDSNYNTLTLTSASNQTSADNSYAVNGINVTSPSASIGNCTGATNTSSNNKCDVSFTFTVQNAGNSDVFISKTPGVAVATTSSPSTSSTTLQAYSPVPVAQGNDTSVSYDVPANGSRTFTLAGTFSQIAGGGYETFAITKVYFGTSTGASVNGPQGTAGSNAASYINFGLEPLFVSKNL